MKTIARVAQLVVLLFVCVDPATAQVATGTPPFATLSGGPDVINLANLNVHLDVPILDTAGRGIPFSYHLTFDGSVWTPVTSSGVTKWSPVFNMGWLAQTTIHTGYISYTRLAQNCDTPPPIQQWITFKNFIYYDAWGRSHTFPGTMVWDPMNCSTGNQLALNKTATDGSGLSLAAAITGAGAPTTHNIKTKEGQVTNPPLNLTTGYSGTTATATDRNGNQISVSSTSNTATYTDTIGNTAMTISGSGTTSSPIVFSYTPPGSAHCSATSSGLACFTVNYTNYTVATNFGASGIGEYKSAAAVPLISSITQPDGTQYTFTYELTPSTPSSGACTPYAGTTCTTARLASVKLPTGGTISYQYNGFTGCTTGNNGAFPDGSTSCLKRTTPDGTWTYTRVLGTAPASTTTVIDAERDTVAPSGNETIIKFQGIYETQRLAYTGLASTLLQTIDTCYNTAAKPCTGTAITLPITQRDVYVTLGTQVAKHTTKYNSTYGMLTEQDDYDYGAGATGGLLSKELITYASLTNGIVSAPSQITTQDGSGTTTSQTTYTYDVGTPTPTGAPQHVGVSGSRGNVTTIARLVAGTTSLSTNNTYDDAGNVRIATDVNGAQTTYSYSTSAATCGFAFPSSVSEPMSMGRSFTWNCTGGVQTSVTDENGKISSTGYATDPYFWRPNSSTDALSNVTSFLYGTNPSTFVSTMTFNAGASAVQTGLVYDGLGRQSIENHQHGPGVSLWDQVQQTYDPLGRLYQVSAPCVSTGAFTCPMGPSDHPTTNSYDALGRPTNTTDGEGGTASYTYTNNDALVTIGPAPTGENTKRRQMQYDGLNRITSVCEITSLSGAGTCAQNASVTGYWTKYAYGPGNVVTVTQNAQAGVGSQQTRTYNYDDIGRLTSETNPESGTTTYTYDVIPTGCSAAGTSSAGDLVRRQDPASDNNCFQYDLLHRVTYVGSRTGCKRFAYDNHTITASRPSGITITNAIGRMNEAETDNCSATPPTPITDEWFSYTARGEVLDLWESTPNSGGYYPVAAAYWANGAMSSLVGANGYSMTWGVDGEGRTSSAGSGSPLFGTTYNAASQPTQLSFSSANTDGDTFTYDSTGRMKTYTYTVNSQSLTGSLTWNASGTLSSLLITDPFNAANTQNCAYSHDDLVRIASVNCGASTWQQNFAYDPFGNITKTVPTGGTGNAFQSTYSATTNHISTVGSASVTYDANGDVTNDSIHTYTWDGFGNATTIDGNGMIYDALDRMVEQNRSGSNTEFIYSPTGFKMQIMNGPTATTDFVPLPGGASVVYQLSGVVHYRHPDWLGSSRFASTTSHTVLYDGAYAPFGEPYAQSGTTDLSFTGMNSDTSGGLYDFLYREYSTQGRWPSPDPAGLAAADFSNPQSLNRYAYLGGSPLGAVDPLGFGPHPIGPACLNPAAHCGPGPSCFQQLNGWQQCNSNPNTPNCNLDGVSTDCGIVSGLINSGGAGPIAAPSNVTYLPGGGAVITQLECVSGGIQGALSTTCNVTGTTVVGAPSPYGSTAWLQTKVFFQALGRNFTDEFKEGGCVARFGEGAESADFLGFIPPGQPIIEDAIKGTAATMALNHAAGRVLTVPLRSSIVRGILETGESIAGALGPAYLLGLSISGAVAEGRALVNGTCH